jgi:hypothetical protein
MCVVNCLEIPCSNRGGCISTNNEPQCICEQGYWAVDLECLPDPPESCDGQQCSGQGECVEVDGKPARCICNVGWTPFGLSCVPQSCARADSAPGSDGSHPVGDGGGLRDSSTVDAPGDSGGKGDSSASIPAFITTTTIPGGTFDMGSTGATDEQPVHAVTLPPFELMNSEVTVSHYRRCVTAGHCTVPLEGGLQQLECRRSRQPSGDRC